ncbi:hypothetical protein [Aeromicrobium sp. UC242_57]|uniref:hypothetical protein n=1 Tax=Aeromicrobium sp. UC242_57 TaxID=3374624 RepID=UPI0037B03BE6
MAGSPTSGKRPNKMVMISLIFPLFMAIALPGLYLAAFHEPTPDRMRVEIIGTSPSAQQLAQGLTMSSDGAFDATTVANRADAVSHLKAMSTRGAYDPSTGVIYVASAGSPAAEQAVATTFADVAADSGIELTVEDVVPLPEGDRLGVTFLFLGLAGVLVGFTTATVLGVALGGVGLRRGWASSLA